MILRSSVTRLVPRWPALVFARCQHACMHSAVRTGHKGLPPLQEQSIRVCHSALQLDSMLKLHTIHALDEGDNPFASVFDSAYRALAQAMGWEDAISAAASAQNTSTAPLPGQTRRGMVCLWHGYAPVLTQLSVHATIATIGCSVNSFVYNAAPVARFVALTGIEVSAHSSIVPFSTQGAALPALDNWHELFSVKDAHWLLLSDNTCTTDDCVELFNRLQALFPNCLVAGAKATEPSSATGINVLMQHVNKFTTSTSGNPSATSVGLALVCDSRRKLDIKDLMAAVTGMYGNAEFDSWKPLHLSSLLQSQLFGVQRQESRKHQLHAVIAQLFPVFIVDAVVVPGQIAEFRIFEPRYKLMIRRAIIKNTQFCIALPPHTVRSGYAPSSVPSATTEIVESAIEGVCSTVRVNSSTGTAQVATIVSLNSLELTPENGVRISVTGTSRFACHDFVVAPSTFGLIHGAGRQVHDCVDKQRCDQVILNLKKVWQGNTSAHLLFRKVWASWQPAHPIPPFEDLNAEQLSWWLAEKLQVSEHKRQTYLECTTTHERLQMQLMQLQDKVNSLQIHVNSAAGR
jgi:Lon protease-like protein